MFGQAIGLRFANGMTLITGSLPDTASSTFGPRPEPLIQWDMADRDWLSGAASNGGPPLPKK